MTEDLHPSAPPVLTTLRAQLRDLHPGEARVGELILERPHWVIEATLAEVAAEAGVSGATVVRTAQRLGYRGFPHLRVMLARDAGAPASRTGASGSTTAAGETVRTYVESVARSAEAMVALISPQAVERVVETITDAERVLVVGTGVSAPVATDLAMRLCGIGRPADAPPDHLDQQIRARLLGPADVCVAVSGTGASRSTLRAGRAARDAGACLISLSSFAGSPLSALATVEVVVGVPGEGFSDELHTTSRIPQLILNGALVDAVRSRLGHSADGARAKVLDVVAEELVDEP